MVEPPSLWYAYPMNAREIISYLLPHVVTAGTYSAQIQKRVATHDAKDGDTPFHHALSDADLTIQAYLEVVLLARFPELNYYSEEQAQSLNRKYFLGGSALEVLVDPVDGTRPYIDGREYYQVIVTIHDAREITGAIAYLPRRSFAFVASKGDGAYKVTTQQILDGERGSKMDVTRAEGPLQTFNAKELVARLRPSFDIIDHVDAYMESPGKYYSTDLLEGKASGVVHRTCQAIDGGALGFIATEAGGVMTDFHGKPLRSFREFENRTIPEVVVAANREVHQAILAALARR